MFLMISPDHSLHVAPSRSAETNVLKEAPFFQLCKPIKPIYSSELNAPDRDSSSLHCKTYLTKTAAAVHSFLYSIPHHAMNPLSFQIIHPLACFFQLFIQPPFTPNQD